MTASEKREKGLQDGGKDVSKRLEVGKERLMKPRGNSEGCSLVPAKGTDQQPMGKAPQHSILAEWITAASFHAAQARDQERFHSFRT